MQQEDLPLSEQTKDKKSGFAHYFFALLQVFDRSEKPNLKLVRSIQLERLNQERVEGSDVKALQEAIAGLMQQLVSEFEGHVHYQANEYKYLQIPEQCRVELDGLLRLLDIGMDMLLTEANLQRKPEKALEAMDKVSNFEKKARALMNKYEADGEAVIFYLCETRLTRAMECLAPLLSKEDATQVQYIEAATRLAHAESFGAIGSIDRKNVARVQGMLMKAHQRELGWKLEDEMLATLPKANQ